jgi:hypothetical protein
MLTRACRIWSSVVGVAPAPGRLSSQFHLQSPTRSRYRTRQALCGKGGEGGALYPICEKACVQALAARAASPILARLVLRLPTIAITGLDSS